MRLVLVVVDSLRADAPGFADGFCRTPALDRLASEGLTFTRCVSSAPWTVPSLAAMLTGTFAHRLGVYRWDHPLPPQYPSVFTAARDLGYRVASFVFDPAFLFSASPEAAVVGSSQSLDTVVDWLRHRPERDLLALVHIWSTHFPYVDRPMTAATWDHVADRVLHAMNAHPSEARSKARALYRRAVEHMSESVLPRLVDAACAHHGSRNAAVVLTGDHGETWGDREADLAQPLRDVFDLHGNHLRDEALAVPLVLWAPGVVTPGRLCVQVRTVDIAPTLLHLLGDPDSFESEGDLGIDGWSLLAPDAMARPRPAVACQSRNLVSTRIEDLPDAPEAVWTALAALTERWKYLWEPAASTRRAFDLATDPTEGSPLPSDAAPAWGWELLEAQWAKATCAPRPDAVQTRLRKLGYLS